MPIFSVAKHVGATLKRNQHMFRGTKHSHRAGFDQSHGNFQEFPTVKYVELLVGGFKHYFYVPFHIWLVILPIDVHSIIFQNGHIAPPYNHH